MNFQFYVEKLKNSENFRKFSKEKDNKGAFPCSCFFVIDREEQGKGDKQHFDFYVPSNKKAFSFALENNAEKIEIERKSDDEKNEKVPGKVSIEHDFDFQDIEELIEEKIESEGIDKKIQKMLFSFQNINGKDMFIATIFITSLGLINLTIDVEKMKITDFKKRSLLDMMNIFKKDK